MAGKVKRSTIKYKKKRDRENLKAKIFGTKKSGSSANKQGSKSSRRQRPRTAKEELRDEEKSKGKGKGNVSAMDADAFLDQDFETNDDAFMSEDDDLSEDSLSSLDESTFDVTPGDEEEEETSSRSKAQRKKLKKEVRKEAEKLRDNLAKKINKEAKSHKETLQQLKEKDPEFYGFLQDTDNDLLQFDEEESESDSEASGSESEDQSRTKKRKDESNVFYIDKSSIDKVCMAALNKPSVKAVQNVVKMYRLACHYGDDEEETDKMSFRLSDSNVFNELMLFVLKNIDGIFRSLLNHKPSDDIAKVMLSKKWKKVAPLIKSYLGNTLHLILHLTETNLNAYIFQRLRASVDLFTVFPYLTKKVMKASLKFFGKDLGDEKADRTLRIQSVLFIRSLIVNMGDTFKDECYKGLYRTFQSCAKFVNHTNMKSLQFMQSCLVEILGVNPDALYKHVFIFIREIALHVRLALTSKTKESIQKVYSWQVICSLDLIEQLVSRYGANESDVLNQLAHPLVQMMMIISTLVSSSRYLPLRFHVLRAILRLAKSAKIYIPVSPIILEALHFSELGKKPSGFGDHMDISGLLKVSKPTTRTISFQEQCVDQVILLLTQHTALWSNHIAFPELFLPLGVRLKSYMKSDFLPKKFKGKIAAFLEAGKKRSEFILKKRQIVSFSPRNLAEVSMFMDDLEGEGLNSLQKFLEALVKQTEARKQHKEQTTVLLKEDDGGDANPIEEDEEMTYEGEIMSKKKTKKAKSTPSVVEEPKDDDGLVDRAEDKVEDFDFEMSSDSDEDTNMVQY